MSGQWHATDLQDQHLDCVGRCSAEILLCDVVAVVQAGAREWTEEVFDQRPAVGRQSFEKLRPSVRFLNRRHGISLGSGPRSRWAKHLSDGQDGTNRSSTSIGCLCICTPGPRKVCAHGDCDARPSWRRLLQAT